MAVLFNILFLLIPLIFYKGTSELFEFNKIITLYVFTILITGSWLYRSIINKSLIFRRTILDLPLVLYLFILLLSTFFSLDPRTSLLGYYGRFNGGLVSQICYALLYWAFVSNLNAKQALNTTYYILFSTALASALAIAERFGIFITCGLMGFNYTESCWVQDVQNRVFSTLGQPNWLAAIVTALLPISSYQLIFSQNHKSKFLSFKSIIFLLLNVLFFITLIFTKSRSGYLAFGISSLIFWSYIFWQTKSKYIKEFLVLFSISLVLFFIVQPPSNNHNSQIITSSGTSLESGGTESGTIRKYVWIGALNIFRSYPILGTGPETFAFVFPKYKPIEHNLTSEWNFIYNKAHNEYLNYLSTTGILGFTSYLILIFYSILQVSKTLKFPASPSGRQNSKQVKNLNQNVNSYLFAGFDFLSFGVLAGYISILITNFFGFSVVPTSLLFFLFPALVVADSSNQKLESKKIQGNSQWVLIFVLLLIIYYLLLITYHYWQADYQYNLSKNNSSVENIEKAISLSPNETVFRTHYANLLSEVAVEFIPDQEEKAVSYGQMALDQINIANRLFPRSVNVKNVESGIYYKFAIFDQKYLNDAENTLKNAILLSPLDPKIHYQLGILNIKNNKLNEAIVNFEKAVSLKPNYKEGRFALALTYKDLGKNDEAKKQLQYILEFIDPNDDLTKRHLEDND